MKRRTFIQRLAGTGIVLPMAMGFPRVRAFARSPKGSPFMKLADATNDNVMVIIRLAGGNDGLNTTVPFTNDIYYTKRKKGSADDLSIAAETVIRLDGKDTIGLHPNLAPLRDLYNEGKMAVVQNVGYPNQNQSHFRSTDIWLSGSDATTYDNAGWYAKYLEELYPDYPSVLPAEPFAIELGTFLSTTLVGENSNMGVAVSDLSYIPGAPDPDPVLPTHAGDEEAYVREIARQANIFSNAIIAAASRQLTNRVTFPTTPLGVALASISRLVAAGMGTKMYIVNIGGYDTHTNQLASQATLHQALADAVSAFQRDLEAFGTAPRVSVMTISEFGRRVESNGTGTDHGSAAPLFVFGQGVLGGFIGADPDLANLEGGRNIRMEHDFRQVYASVLSQWFGASNDQLIPALPREFTQLPIFRNQATSVDAPTDRTASLELGQNYPNPAASITTIPLAIGSSARNDARLIIYAVDGRPVASERVVSGSRNVTIDTRSMPSGTYVYELSVGDERLTRRMVVAR